MGVYIYSLNIFSSPSLPLSLSLSLCFSRSRSLARSLSLALSLFTLLSAPPFSSDRASQFLFPL